MHEHAILGGMKRPGEVGAEGLQIATLTGAAVVDAPCGATLHAVIIDRMPESEKAQKNASHEMRSSLSFLRDTVLTPALAAWAEQRQTSTRLRTLSRAAACSAGALQSLPLPLAL